MAELRASTNPDFSIHTSPPEDLLKANAMGTLFMRR